MFHWLKRLLSLLTLAAFAASGSVFVPPAVDAWQTLRRWDAPERAADLHLDGLLPADYRREAEAALAEDDPELAKSILALAARRRVAMPPELAERVTTALAARPGVVGQVWNGAVFGEGDTAAGFAAAMATDLMVVGDLRDLAREGMAYPDYDPVVVALAALGVGLTAATVSSAGAAAPVKLGASVLKLARRTGKLGLRLGDDLLRLAVRAVDTDALQSVWHAGRRLDLAAARRAAQKVLRPDAAGDLRRAGEAVGTVARRQGPRAALDTLKAAENTAELTRLGRIAEKAGPTFRGALRLAPRLAKGVAKISKVFLKLLLWVVSGLVWIAWLTWTSLRLLRQSARLAAAALRFALRNP